MKIKRGNAYTHSSKKASQSKECAYLNKLRQCCELDMKNLKVGNKSKDIQCLKNG